MLRLFWIAITFVAAAPALAAEESDPLRLVKRMVAATSALDYDGVFIYQRGQQIDSMRLIHRVHGETELERLVSLSGPPREVIRDGTEVRCLFSDDRKVMVDKIEPKDFLTFGLSNSVEGLANYYTFALDGDDRVAGREARVISITPIEQDRYGYRLWVDREHGLLLKSVILDQSGHALEQVQFADIKIGEHIPESAFEAEIEGSGYTWHVEEADEAGPAADRTNWRARWLPAGFEMRDEKVQSMPTSKMPVSHMVYSDGLAIVSVFVEEISGGGEPPFQGQSSMGAVNAMSRVADKHQITVVGEVPLPTLRQIAASVAGQH